MATTLNVRNESAADIELGKGDAEVTIAAGKDEELEEELLSSSAFAEALADGQLRFVLTQDPDADRISLARRLLPKLIRGLGPRFLALGGRLEVSLHSLDRQRLEYNHSWKQTEFLLKTAKASAEVVNWDALDLKVGQSYKPAGGTGDTFKAQPLCVPLPLSDRVRFEKNLTIANSDIVSKT